MEKVSEPNTNHFSGFVFRKDMPCLLLLFLLVVLSWYPRLQGPIDLRWDGAVYYVLGTSLSQGNGYRLLNEPGEISATQYPPLLPAVIAAHQIVLGTRDPLIVGEWLRISWFCFFTIYTIAVYFLAKRFMPRAAAVLVTIMAVFNFHTIYVSNLCYPEILFSALSIGFFLVLLRSDKKTHATASFLLAVACFLLKASGIALLVTWIAKSVFHRKFKNAAIRLIVALIPVMSWLGYVAWVESGDEYIHPQYEYQRADYLFWNVSYAKNLTYRDPFIPELGRMSIGDMAIRFTTNLTQVPVVFSELLTVNRKAWRNSWEALKAKTKLPIPWVATFLSLSISGVLLFLGLLFLLFRRQWEMAFYLLTSIVLICLVPWRDQMARYAVPLTPFLLAGSASLLMGLARFHAGQKRLLLLGLSGVLVLILVQEFLPLKHTYGRDFAPGKFRTENGQEISFRWFDYNSCYHALDRGLEWLRSQSRPGDIIAASMPAYAYLRTGLKSVMPPLEADPERAQKLLESVPVRFVVVDSIEFHIPGKYSMIPIAKFRDRWRNVYTDTSGGLSIYEFAE